MNPDLYHLFEPAVVFATLLGTAFGVKLLIWGKGPIRRIRRTADSPALEQRMADLEDRVGEYLSHQSDRLAEIEERLDFTERVLTRQREAAPRPLANPEQQPPE